MRVVGVIPSRWGSTRFPGKSLHPICGKPLVQWVAEAALRAKALDKVVVATDVPQIAEALQGVKGVRVAMTRSDHPSGTDRVAEAAAPNDDDIIINIQGDEPLIEPELIDALAERLKNDRRYEMATAATRIASLRDLEARSVVKVVCDRDGGALYFSRLPIPCKRDGEPDVSTYLRHIGIYGYRGGFLKRLVKEPPCALELSESLEQLRAMWLGARIAVIETPHTGAGVDTPEDVANVEALLRERAGTRQVGLV